MENASKNIHVGELEESSLSELDPTDLGEEEWVEEEEPQQEQQQQQEFPTEPETNPNAVLDLEKLDMFYNLKNKYEMDKKERCNKFALAKENINWKMKRAYFASKKPKCVNCKRKVGSLFSIKHEDGFRRFIAKCGDPENPCEFKIEFKMPDVVRIDKKYHALLHKLNELQESIVVTKNKVLFGMMDPASAVTQFDELKNEITAYTTELENYSTRLMNVTHNQEKNDELLVKINEFNENVAEVNLIVQKCLFEDEPIKSIVDYFVDTIDVSAKYLAKLKYAEREVETVLDSKGDVIECIYRTFDYLPAQLEMPVAMEVIDYNVNAEISNSIQVEETNAINANNDNANKKTKNNKTKKNRQTVPKNKTIRNLDNQEDLNAVMKEILQTIIMENRLTITRREIYELIEDQYHVSDVRGKYGNVIKKYFQSNVALWVQVYPEIMDLAYTMAQNKTIQDTTVSQFMEELNKTHPDVDFSPFKKVIKETLIRYVTLLNSVSLSGESTPRPDWPTQPE